MLSTLTVIITNPPWSRDMLIICFTGVRHKVSRTSNKAALDCLAGRTSVQHRREAIARLLPSALRQMQQVLPEQGHQAVLTVLLRDSLAAYVMAPAAESEESGRALYPLTCDEIATRPREFGLANKWGKCVGSRFWK